MANVTGKQLGSMARQRPADDLATLRRQLQLPNGDGPPTAPVMIAARNGTRIANVMPKANGSGSVSASIQAVSHRLPPKSLLLRL